MIPFSNTISNIVGILLPSYSSYKALKYASNNNRWLKYWTVFSLLKVVEMLSLPHLWTPYYFDLRLFFLLWLQSSTFQGSDIIFNKCLKPFLDKYEKSIDLHLQEFKDNALTVIKKNLSVVGDFLYRQWQREEVQLTVRSTVKSILSFVVSQSSTVPSVSSVPSEASNNESISNSIPSSIPSAPPYSSFSESSRQSSVIIEHLAQEVNEIHGQLRQADDSQIDTDVNHPENLDPSVRRRVPQIRKAFEELKPNTPNLNRSPVQNKKEI